MDVRLSYIIRYLVIYMLLFCLLDIVDDQAEVWRGYEYIPWMDLGFLSLVRKLVFCFRHLQRWSGSFLLHRMMCLSREMFLLDLLGRCMGHRGCNHLIVP